MSNHFFDDEDWSSGEDSPVVSFEAKPEDFFTSFIIDLFLIYIKNPRSYFKKIHNKKYEEQKELFLKFKNQYESYKIGKYECRTLDLMFSKNLTKSTNETVHIRMNQKSRDIIKASKFVETLTFYYEDSMISQELDDFIFECYKNIREKNTNRRGRKQINNDIFLDIYKQWIQEESEFMNELDLIVRYDPMKVIKNFNTTIIKEIKEKKIENFDFDEIFPEIEENMKVLSEYFSLGESNVEMNSLSFFIELKEMKLNFESEIDGMKDQIEQQKKMIENLNQLVTELIDEKSTNPNIPKDAFLIEEE
eukprot:gene4859-8453_t